MQIPLSKKKKKKISFSYMLHTVFLLSIDTISRKLVNTITNTVNKNIS